MRVAPDQLHRHLGKNPAPVYCLTGDEPLQMREAADAVRQAARQAGFAEREILDDSSGSLWEELAQRGNSISLFGERSLLELRLASGKIGQEGAKALQSYLAAPPENHRLLILLPKLDAAQRKAKWIQAIEQHGVLVTIWPIDSAKLPGWLQGRMRARGLQPTAQVGRLLAEHTEGNLLAADQEISKLHLLLGSGPVDENQLLASISDSARFSVFDLLDSVLSGQAERALRVLRGLRGEGLASQVVLWGLSKELRSLAGLGFQHQQGAALPGLFRAAGIWEKRQPLVTSALQRLPTRRCHNLLARCAKVDLAIKGQDEGDPWLLMEDIVLDMARPGSRRAAAGASGS